MNILPSNKIVVTWRGDNTFATNHDAAHSVRLDFNLVLNAENSVLYGLKRRTI